MARVGAETWLDDDDDAWDRLCEEHGDLFQTTAVSRAGASLGARTWRLRIRDAAARAVAAVAVVEAGSRKLGPAERAFARFHQVSGGPLVLDPDADLGAVLPALEAFAKERGATDTTWKPTWPDLGERLDFAGSGWEIERTGIAWRTLPEDPDDVLATFSRVHRKAVRRATRAGIEVRDAASLGEVMDLVDRSFVRAGLEPRNRDYVTAVQRRLSECGTALALVAEGSEGPLAGLLAARCGDALFNLFHGRVDGDGSGAANLLHLRLFERAVRNGCRRVHTGGARLEEDAPDAGLEGITRFKRHLGFDVTACPRGTKVHRPLSRSMRRTALGVYRLLRGGLR